MTTVPPDSTATRSSAAPDAPPPASGWRSLADASWAATGSPARPLRTEPATGNEADPAPAGTERKPSTRWNPGRRIRLDVQIGLIGLVLALALSTVWLETRASQLAAPRVTLLGSGSSLSVLITAGPARVLLAAGDDPAAASRALGTALAGGSQRIDLLVVGATDAALAVPAAWVRSGTARQVVRIGRPHPGRQTGDLPHGIPQLPADARITVAPGLTVEILTVEIPGDQRGDFDLAWQAVVRSGSSTVTILSDTKYADRFAPSRSTGVLVALRGDDFGTMVPGPAGALVVAAHDVEGNEVRSLLPPLLDHDLPVIRVHDGLTVGLNLTDAGVRLAPGDVTRIGPGGSVDGKDVETLSTPVSELNARDLTPR